MIDLSSVGPASRATRILGDYGAGVVKVTPVPSKADKQIVPPQFAYSAERFNEFVAIDLQDEGGKEALWALIDSADVLVESFRPGVFDRLGFSAEQLMSRCPRLVYCSTSGYGRSGPHSNWAGHDLNYLAVGGYLAMSGRTCNELPAFPGSTIADAAGGGMHAALAIMAALIGRERSGRGAVLDASATDGVSWLTSLITDEYLATGVEPAPGKSVLSGGYACYSVYRASDGGFLAVAAIEHRFFSNLCHRLGYPDLIDRQMDPAAQTELRAAFEEVFSTRPRDEWVAELAGFDTCVSPVLEISEVASAARQARRVVRVLRADGTTFEQLGPLLAGMEPLADVVRIPEREGGRTEVVLAESGVPDEKVTEWRRRGSIGCASHLTGESEDLHR